MSQHSSTHSFSPFPLLSFSSSLQDKVYKLHRLEDGPSREVEVSRTDLLQFYREMTIIREMEERARELYREKKIRGFLHVYVGQVRVFPTLFMTSCAA